MQRQTLIRVLVPARDALVTYWRSGALAALVGLTAIGMASAVDTLGDRAAPRNARLAPGASPVPAMDVEWTPDAETPAKVRARATRELLGLLSLTAWGAIAVGGCALLFIGGSRAAGRRIDVQVRRAIGADRRALFASFMAEGTTLSIIAGGGGIVLGAIAARYAAASWPGATASWHWMSLAMLAPIAASLMLGAFFPALFLRPRRVVEVPPLPPPLTLASVQLAVALAILVASSLVSDRAKTLLGPEAPGVAGGEVYRLELPGLGSADRMHRYAGLLAGFAADSQVATASLSSPGALLGLGTVDYLRTECGNCYVGGIFLKWRILRAAYHSASADTFSARGTPISEGRTFTAADTVGATPVAIVNRQLAARYFEGGRPLGRVIWLGGHMSGTGYKVVGVVDDGRPTGFGGGQLPREAVYLSALQHPPETAELLIRPKHAEAALHAGHNVLSATLATVPEPLGEASYRLQDAAPLVWFGRWFRVEGLAALLLATAGVLGLMYFWIRALRPEFALRRALGARHRQIVAFVLGHAMSTALKGVAVAVVFLGPFLWGELARMVPGLPSLPAGRVVQFGVLLALAATVGALAPAVLAARRPPAADLGS